MKLIISVVIISLFLSVASAQSSAGWKGIIPFHSTKQDVEKLLGKPTVSDITYNVNGQRVTFIYSPGPCTRGQLLGWNVPFDTVLTIIVAPAESVKYEDLQMDKSGFEFRQNAESKSVVYYVNVSKGIVVEVFDGIVSTISYHGAKDDYDRLKCK